MRRPLLWVAAATCGLACTPRPHADDPTAAPGPTGSVAAVETTAPGAEPSSRTPAEDDDAWLAELDAAEDTRILEIPGCTDLEGANQCSGVGATMLGCTALGNILQEAPTRELVNCLSGKSGTAELCSARALLDCALGLARTAQPAPDMAARCARYVAECSAPENYREHFSQQTCAGGLTLLRPRAQRDFVECMARSCDLELCVSGLL